MDGQKNDTSYQPMQNFLTSFLSQASLRRDYSFFVNNLTNLQPYFESPVISISDISLNSSIFFLWLEIFISIACLNMSDCDLIVSIESLFRLTLFGEQSIS